MLRCSVISGSVTKTLGVIYVILMLSMHCSRPSKKNIVIELRTSIKNIHISYIFFLTEFHAQYFNTIPLKSNSQRKLLDQSQMAYKDQPPTYNPTSDPSKANGDTVEIMEPSSAEVPLDNVDHRRNVSQDVSEPSPNSAASNSSVNKPQSPKSVAEPGANAVGSNPQPDQATHQNPCQGSTHWMEQYLNELYSRKRWLTEALLQAEVSLKRLICEETVSKQHLSIISQVRFSESLPDVFFKFALIGTKYLC